MSRGTYRSIIRHTALFSGVQGFQILIAAIRVKVVAVLLGVEGMGIMSLLNSTLLMLQSVTGLGIERGAVRELSRHEESQKPQAMATIRHWSLLAALGGAVVMLSLAPTLSRWTFGNEDYAVAYMWLSLALLADTLSKTELAVLQGLQKLRLLARCNLVGSFMGLVISLPVYYVWGVNGIVAGIIAYPACLLAAAVYERRHVGMRAKRQSPAVSVRAGKELVMLGIMLTISGFVGTLSAYLFNIYLNNFGSTQDVGLYHSGFGLIDKYVAVLFVAMLTDYYPRLSAVYTNNAEVRHILTRQTNVAVLVLVPIVAGFITTAPLIVRIFLSSEFLAVIPFLLWAILGMVFKVPATSLAYILIAKGDSRMFLLTEVISWTTILCFNIVGYELWGIEGIGIAFLGGYASYFIMMMVVCARKYGITLRPDTVRLLLVAAGVGVVVSVCYRMLVPEYPLVGYGVCGAITGISLLWAARRLMGYMREK